MLVHHPVNQETRRFKVLNGRYWLKTGNIRKTGRKSIIYKVNFEMGKAKYERCQL